VLAVGNLVPKKGFDILIRAVGYLKRRGVAVRLRILGEGPERGALETLVREQALRDRVQLPGHFQHKELATHLAEAAAFVMPSRVTASGTRDGIPTVVIEAWLSGTPVVASLVGGMSEVIVNEQTGLVFAPEEPEALADCLVRLVESPELRRSLADAGRAVAMASFSCEKNVFNLLEEIRGHAMAGA
jgi:glycosyltransferase involved in cell wall biosynthesis